MNKQFLRNWVLCITLATTAFGSTGKVWADVASTPAGGETVRVDLIAGVLNASDDEIANSVAEVNQHLVGAAKTNDEKASAELAATQFSEDSKKPGFRDRMISVLKKTSHVGGKAGIIVLTAVGVTGSGILATSIAPLVIGTNMASAIFTGKAAIPTHRNEDPDKTLNDSQEANAYMIIGGVVPELYLLAAICTVGWAPWTWMGAIIERVTQGMICSKQVQGPDLQRYCRISEETYDDINYASAEIGYVIGDGIHLAIVLPVHLIGKLFHHHKKVIAPAPIAEAPAQNVAPMANVEGICEADQVFQNGVCVQN